MTTNLWVYTGVGGWESSFSKSSPQIITEVYTLLRLFVFTGFKSWDELFCLVIFTFLHKLFCWFILAFAWFFSGKKSRWSLTNNCALCWRSWRSRMWRRLSFRNIRTARRISMTSMQAPAMGTAITAALNHNSFESTSALWLAWFPRCKLSPIKKTSLLFNN